MLRQYASGQGKVYRGQRNGCAQETCAGGRGDKHLTNLPRSHPQCAKTYQVYVMSVLEMVIQMWLRNPAQGAQDDLLFRNFALIGSAGIVLFPFFAGFCRWCFAADTASFAATANVRSMSLSKKFQHNHNVDCSHTYEHPVPRAVRCSVFSRSTHLTRLLRVRMCVLIHTANTSVGADARAGKVVG